MWKIFAALTRAFTAHFFTHQYVVDFQQPQISFTRVIFLGRTQNLLFFRAMNKPFLRQISAGKLPATQGRKPFFRFCDSINHALFPFWSTTNNNVCSLA